MIYQCYFAENQRERLFKGALYRGFGLEPVVNPDLTRNCPELDTRHNRTALSEYAAMLHLWRNPLDAEPWIGFTSYRQLDKSPTCFADRDREPIELLLRSTDILGWGFYRLVNATSGNPGSIAEISETCHPGITAFLEQLLARTRTPLPAAYFEHDIGLFANYWIMSRENFDAFMRWSAPLVSWCLTQRESLAFLSTNPRSVGFVAERLFILWYLLLDKRLANLGPLETLPFRETGAAERIAS